MTHDFDVVVCGMGPVGLLVANLLGQLDISVLVVDAEAAPTTLPRAIRIDHEAMRVLQQLGLTERLEPEMCVTDGMDFINGEGTFICGFRTADLESLSGWRFTYLFHQPDLEAALFQNLASFPLVISKRGLRLVSATNEDAAVAVHLEDSSGSSTQVMAKFLVGCDGGRSSVRDSVIHASAHDMQFDQSWLVVDAHQREETPFRPFSIQVCDPSRPATYIPGPGKQRRWEFRLLPGETPEDMSEPGLLASLLKPWVELADIDVIRSAVYDFHAIAAEQWRLGRTLIAGDAAHQTPPFLGQGLCGGFRDAANLTWKIGAVIDGTAPLSFLDTYQQERLPHFWSILEQSVRVGNIVGTLDREQASRRDAEFLAALSRGENPMGNYAVPGLMHGLIGRGEKAGSIFPQFMVSQLVRGRQGTTLKKFDDLAQPGTKLLIPHTAADLVRSEHDALAVAVWEVFDESAEGPIGEEGPATRRLVSDQYANWLQNECALIRPDNYVYDTCAPAQLDQMLSEYRVATAGR